MLTSKICREHASKCNRVAETIPRGAQREMFLDMARRWIDLTINLQPYQSYIACKRSTRALSEPYRFGSGIVKAPIS